VTPSLHVRFFTRAGCHLCDAALAVVKRAQRKIPFAVELVDIDSNPSYASAYGNVIPVITVNNIEVARSFVEEKKLIASLTTVEKSLKIVENRSLDRPQ